MHVEGCRRIAQSRDHVFAALQDPDVLQQCIGSCGTVTQASDAEFAIGLRLAAGITRMCVPVRLLFSERDPPHGCTVDGEAGAGWGGRVRGQARVRLAPLEDGHTMLSWTVTVDLSGAGFHLASRVLPADVQLHAGRFVDRFAELVAGPVAPAVERLPDAAASVSQPGTARRRERDPLEDVAFLGAAILAAALFGIVL